MGISVDRSRWRRIGVAGKEAGVKAYKRTPNPDDAARRSEASSDRPSASLSHRLERDASGLLLGVLLRASLAAADLDARDARLDREDAVVRRPLFVRDRVRDKLAAAREPLLQGRLEVDRMLERLLDLRLRRPRRPPAPSSRTRTRGSTPRSPPRSPTRAPARCARAHPRSGRCRRAPRRGAAPASRSAPPPACRSGRRPSARGSS